MACELRRFRTARHRYQRSGPPTKGQGAPHQRCNGDAPRLAATKPPAPSICSPQSGSECDRRYSRAARRTPVDAATGARRSEQGRQRGLHLCRSGRVSVRLRRPNEDSRYEHLTADEEDRDRPRVDRAVLPFVELVGGDRPAPADPRFRVSWRPRVGATAVVYWGTGLQQLAVPGDRRPTAGRSASRGPPLGFARGLSFIHPHEAPHSTRGGRAPPPSWGARERRRAASNTAAWPASLLERWPRPRRLRGRSS